LSRKIIKHLLLQQQNAYLCVKKVKYACVTNWIAHTPFQEGMVREDSASTGRKRSVEILISAPKDWRGRQTGKTASTASFSTHLVFFQGLYGSTHIPQASKKYCHEKVTHWIGVLNPRVPKSS